MSDINFKTGWLKDPADNQKFAPKTTTNQVLTGDGERLTDKLAEMEAESAKHADRTTSNTFTGEQRTNFPGYCNTVHDIASGIGCSLKNARALDNQMIVGEVYAPYTSATDEAMGMQVVKDEIPFYAIDSTEKPEGSSSQKLNKTLLGKITRKGFEGNAATATSATKATQDSDGFVFKEKYETITNVTLHIENPDVHINNTDRSNIQYATDNVTNIISGALKVPNAANADKATSANSATYAQQDASGNNFAEHYETKTDATGKLTEAKAYSDKIASLTSGFFTSKRDFINGTLITTDIPYSESAPNGAAWLLEIKGNSYIENVPFDLKLQGYIYTDEKNTSGMVNYGGVSNGTFFDDIYAFSYNDVLCFWFPRFSYWQGFDVRITDVIKQETLNKNRVVSITDEAKPENIFKEINFKGHIRKSITSENISGQEVAYAVNAGHDANGNNIANTYETKAEAIGKLDEAKDYTDEKLLAFENAYIKADSNGTIDKLNEIASWIADDDAGAAKIISDVSNKADKSHTHDTYETKTDAAAKLTEAKGYTDTLKNNLTTGSVIPLKAGRADYAERDNNGNVINTTYETKADANIKLSQVQTELANKANLDAIEKLTDDIYEQVNKEVEKVTPFIATYNETSLEELQRERAKGRDIKVKSNLVIPGTYDKDGNLLHTWTQLMAGWKSEEVTSVTNGDASEFGGGTGESYTCDGDVLDFTLPTSYEVNNILGLSTSIDYTDNSTFRQIKLDTLSTEENYLANIDYNKQVGDIYLSDTGSIWYGSSVTLVLKEPLGRYHLVPVCYATPGDDCYNYEGMSDIYYAIVTDKFYLYDNDAGICRSLPVQPGTVLDSFIVNDNYAEESAAIYDMKFYDSYYGLETTTYNLSDNVTMDTSIMACNYAGTGIYPTDLVIPDYVTTIKDNVLAPVDRFYYIENNIPFTYTFLGTPKEFSTIAIGDIGYAVFDCIFNVPWSKGTLVSFDDRLSDASVIMTINYDYDVTDCLLGVYYINQLISNRGNEFIFRGHSDKGDNELVCNENGWSTRNIQVIKLGDAAFKFDYENRRVVLSFLGEGVE